MNEYLSKEARDIRQQLISKVAAKSPACVPCPQIANHVDHFAPEVEHGEVSLEITELQMVDFCKNCLGFNGLCQSPKLSGQ